MDVRRVEVEIGELVLHGFDRIDGDALAESLRSTLGARLAAEGAPGKSRTVDLVQPPALELAHGVGAPALGRAVAKRVYGSIRP